MGIAKQHEAEEAEKAELNEKLQTLLDDHYIDEGTALEGIVKQVIDRNYDSLSTKQMAVYDSYIPSLLAKLEKDLEEDDYRRAVENDHS